MTIRFRTLPALLVALITTMASTLAAAAPLPSNSLYHLPVLLTDQDGRASRLLDRRGEPLLITMFFGNCQFVCPRILEGMKRTEAALTPAERARVPVLAVTFDPARDDIATLKKVATDHGVDQPAFRLARADPREVRKLAAALGIQYRALPGGDFNHTSVLILLDAEGRIAARTANIGEADPVFVKAVKKTLATKTKP